MSPKIVILLAAASLSGAAIAQTAAPAPGSAQDLYQKGLENKGSPNAPAVNAVEGPVTEKLNDNVAAADNTAAAGQAMTAEDRAQYEADRAAYMDALVKHDAAVNRTDARYVRQQVAYADAMTAWRQQVRACKKGYQRACNAPTPNPADFYGR